MEKKEVEFKKSEVSKDKLTYEELENVCHQLSEQSRALYQKLQEVSQKLQDVSMENFFKRLDYLFKVVDNAIAFTSRGYQDFISKCVEEIVSSMQIPEPEEEKTESKE